jgi:hypothetical protein
MQQGGEFGGDPEKTARSAKTSESKLYPSLIVLYTYQQGTYLRSTTHLWSLQISPITTAFSM